MRVLVTGSSGHVGGAIARYLFDQGHDVAGLSRHTAGLPDGISQFCADIAVPDFTTCAVRSFGPCDAIIHAAAELSKDPHNPALSATNGIGTQQMLQLANEWGVRSFVFISGVAVIGRPLQIPVTEDHPLDPPTVYLASKLYGERLVAIARENGLPAVTLRLTAPVGPAMPPGRILSSFVERARAGRPLVLHGMGTRRQNYVDVRDVARAAVLCIQKKVMGLYNVGGAEAIANRDLAERCIEVLRSTSALAFSGQPDPDDDVVWDVSCAAARHAFGYVPAYSIEASIQTMV